MKKFPLKKNILRKQISLEERILLKIIGKNI